MFTYLKGHPEIFMPDYIKEPHFFSKDLHHFKWFTQSYRWITDFDQYMNFFKEARFSKIIGEASIFYLYSTCAAEEIYRFNPKAKILILLRRPTEMIYALYYQLMYLGIDKSSDFFCAYTKAHTPISSAKDSTKLIPYHNISKYFIQVRRYINTFPRDQIFIVYSDEFRAHTNEIYKDVLRFLKVNDSFHPNLKIINKNPVVSG